MQLLIQEGLKLVRACCLVRMKVLQEFVDTGSRNGNVMHGTFTLIGPLVTTSSRSGTVMHGAAPTHTTPTLVVLAGTGVQLA